MHKYKAYGAAALLIISSIGGVSYAQDATATTTAPDSSALTVPAMTSRTWLGVTVTDDGDGITVTQVSANSPAETAQLAVGDVILAVNGTAVDTASDLKAIVDAAASGDVLTLTVQRGTDQLSVDVTLATRQSRNGFGMMGDPIQAAETMLGVTLEAVDGGYQVVSVDDMAIFDLQVGDVITAVNGVAVADLDWMTLFDPTATDNTVTLTIQRDGAETTVEGQISLFGDHDGGRGGRGGFPGGDGQPPPQDGGNRQPPGGGNGGNPPGGPDGSGNPPGGPDGSTAPVDGGNTL